VHFDLFAIIPVCSHNHFIPLYNALKSSILDLNLRRIGSLFSLSTQAPGTVCLASVSPTENGSYGSTQCWKRHRNSRTAPLNKYACLSELSRFCSKYCNIRAQSIECWPSPPRSRGDTPRPNKQTNVEMIGKDQSRMMLQVSLAE
jgi:hypothetical protein